MIMIEEQLLVSVPGKPRKRTCHLGFGNRAIAPIISVSLYGIYQLIPRHPNLPPGSLTYENQLFTPDEGYSGRFWQCP